MGDAPSPYKENKKLDAAGKKVAVGATTHCRIAKSVGHRAQWAEIQKLVKHLPDEFKKRGVELVAEGKTIYYATIRCTLDAADTASRGVNTNVLIRRHVWLSILGFKPEVQQHLLNLPLHGKHLFDPQVSIRC